MEWTDDDLLKRWRASGDADAFRELTLRYGGMVHATCLRVLRNRSDAEDVAQECFESLATARAGPKRNVGGWLHRVATHRSIGLLRSSGRRSAREERYAKGADEAREVTWDEVYAFVDEAIDELPDKFRVSVCAYFLQQRTHESIAREFGLTRSAVSYRIRVGVDRIRETLQRKGVTIAGGALLTLMAEGMGQAAASAEWLERVGRIALSGHTGGGAGALSWTRSSGWLGAGAATLAAIVGIWIVAGGENGEPPANPVSTPQVLAEPVPPVDIERREVIVVPASAVVEPEVVDAIAAPAEPVAIASVPEADEAIDEGASISGWVIDEEGVGLPGFLVHVMPAEALLNYPAVSDFRETFRHAMTDAEGNFKIEDIQFSGQVHVLATGAGYFDESKDMTLIESEERTGVEFSAMASDDFSGRVLDWMGEPVAGAWVVPLEVSRSDVHPAWQYWRRTNEQGEFRFAVRYMGSRWHDSRVWLDSEIMFEVHSEHAGGALFRDSKLTLDDYQEYRIPKPARMFGRLTTAGGAPAGGYELKLYGRMLDDVTLDMNERTFMGLNHSVVTDESGGYLVEGITPSIYYSLSVRTPEGNRVKAYPSGFPNPGRHQSHYSPTLQPGSEEEWNLVVLDERWMEGTIRGALTGRQVPASAYVTVRVYEEKTMRHVGVAFVNRGSSTYRLSLPQSGRHRVVARYGFFDNQRENVPPGAAPWADGDWIVVDEGVEDMHQNLVVAEPFAFSVRVVDRNGLPRESIELYLSAVFSDYSGDKGATSMSVRTDRDGRYTWYTKPGEDVWISTNEDGFARSKTAHVIGVAGESLEARLVLRTRGSISGRFIKQDGSVVSRAKSKVLTWNEQGQELGSASFYSGFDGTFLREGSLFRDRVFVNLQYRREWVWSEPLFYEGPADVDLDLGDIVVPD